MTSRIPDEDSLEYIEKLMDILADIEPAKLDHYIWLAMTRCNIKKSKQPHAEKLLREFVKAVVKG